MSADWWRGAVTYQIYPRSFQDDTGDGIGDLPGIIRRLPHLADLGVDAIWLSPVFRSPMKDMGYDVSDYCDIDPVFGTLGDFDRLVERSHDLGLRLIIDQVLSHSSDQHPAFAESRASRRGPKADWYVWAEPNPDGTPPNNWLSVFGGPAWTWDARRHQYYLHNFLPSQPDFNFHNPEVQEFHLANVQFWLERGVDGFRLDTVNYYFHDERFRPNPPDRRLRERPEDNPYGMQLHEFSKNRPENIAFIERLRALTDRYGGRMMVGEVGDHHHSIRLMGEYSSGRRLHQCYSFELLGHDLSAGHIRRTVEGFFIGAPGGWPMWAFSNHDVMRHAGRWARYGPSVEAVARLSAALLLSLPGSVCLYQGEELGQVDTELAFDELTDPQGIAFWPAPMGRDGCRTPMAWEGSSLHAGFSTAPKTWLPVKPPQAARAADGQNGREGSVLEFYRRMIAFRRESTDLRGAAFRFLDLPAPLLGLARGENTLAVFNLSDQPADIGLPAGRAAIAEAAVVQPPRLHLGPAGFAIFTR